MLSDAESPIVLLDRIVNHIMVIVDLRIPRGELSYESICRSVGIPVTPREDGPAEGVEG